MQKTIVILLFLCVSVFVSAQNRPASLVPTSSLEEKLYNDSSLVDQIMAVAYGRLGCRYKAAGKGPSAFDCAGYTRWVFLHFDITLAPSAGAQLPQGTAIKDTRNLRPGDLAFYGGRGGGRAIGHVVLVTDVDTSTGKFRFIHAASSGIRFDRSADPYWASRYKGACRILPDEAWVSPRRQWQDSVDCVEAERVRAMRVADSIAAAKRYQDSLQVALEKRLKVAEKDVDAHRRPTPSKSPVSQVMSQSDMATKPKRVHVR